MIRAEDNVMLESQKSIYDIASNTEQHFWMTETGSDTGAHITEKTKEDFLADPTNGGGNLLARSNGIAVRDGLTELASFGANGVQVGKSASSHVNVGTTGITMSDGNRTIYEVKQATNPIVMTKTYNRNLYSYTQSYRIEETIDLGRTVSSWSKITMTCTMVRNGQSYKYSPTYTSVPITDEAENYNFEMSVTGEFCHIYLDFGSGYQYGDDLILNTIKLEFNTDQPAIESTIGAYANKTQGGVFRVGTGSGALRNAMLLDWSGDAMFNGDVVAYCEYDSSGGLSLTKDRAIPYAFFYTSETASVSIDVHQVGMLVSLEILVSNDNSVAGGSNISVSNLDNAHIPLPATSRVTGSAYYGNHAIMFALMRNENTDKWQLICRNASPSAVTIAGSNYVLGTMTYIWNGMGYTDD